MRIKSILGKYVEQGGSLENLTLLPAGSEAEKELEMALVQFNTMLQAAAEETAPHKVCAYLYDLANAFNHFYHETKILGEEDTKTRESLIALLVLTKDVLEACIDVLGFEAPDKM